VKHARVSVYLEQLAAATLETADDLRLLPMCMQLVARAPGTIAELMSTTLPMKRIFVLRS
jgi:hypothetical protein